MLPVLSLSPSAQIEIPPPTPDEGPEVVKEELITSTRPAAFIWILPPAVVDAVTRSK